MVVPVSGRLRLLSADPALREQTEYHSRRLAKMGIPSQDVLNGLQLRGRNQEELREITLIVNRCYSEVREAEITLLEELFQAELKSSCLMETLERFTTVLRQFTKADFSRVWFPLAIPGGLKRPICFHPMQQDPRMLDRSWCAATCWSIPLDSLGVLQLGFKRKYPWLKREESLLKIAVDRYLAAAEKARLTDEVIRLNHRMVEIEEKERHRISRELHDEAGQSLLCMRLNLEMMEADAADRPPLLLRLQETRAMAERSLTEIRRILNALNPEVLERSGLGAAIRQLAKRFRDVSAAQIDVWVGELPPLDPRTELLVYRLAQECLANAARHSQAKNVKVHLDFADTNIRLRVQDNGNGFRVDEAVSKPGSYGLAGMRERVALLRGRLKIESQPQRRKSWRGTKIEIELPIGN